MVRGFKFVEGKLVFAPEGGRVDVSVNQGALPSDSPEIDRLAKGYGIPVEEFRTAFGTLPPVSEAAPQAVVEEKPVEKEEAVEVEEKPVVEEEPVEKEAAEKPVKSKRQKSKSKKTDE